MHVSSFISFADKEVREARVGLADEEDESPSEHEEAHLSIFCILAKALPRRREVSGAYFLASGSGKLFVAFILPQGLDLLL